MDVFMVIARNEAPKTVADSEPYPGQPWTIQIGHDRGSAKVGLRIDQAHLCLLGREVAQQWHVALPVKNEDA